ncbi:CotH kinase family protein [Gemella morbillorum]
MATDFSYGGKQIVSGGPFKPAGKDMPSDARTRVESYADIASIPNPHVGLKTTVKVDETNNNKMTDYIVKSLKANDAGVANMLIDEVVRYVDYLGASSGGSVSQEDINTAVNNYLAEHPVAGGATTEQAEQIQANATAIGNESSGLIKEVNDMKSVIGDSNSGLVKEVTDLKANSGTGGSTPVALTEPYNDDIPRIFLSDGILPTSKTSTTMKFEYISKNKRYSGYVDIKCQGTSSMNYPKKNFTIKTFNDKDLVDKLKINFMNWGNQNKFCLKANYIDISHARNVVSARLWGDIVKSRENYLELPELLRTSPNSGAIDGFFVKIYANGVYQGRYTMNIPKDKWMSNMDDSLDQHCILCGENYKSGLFRAAAVIDGTDWSDELHEIVPTSIVDRWNQVINFVMTSSDSDFKANIEQYFDLTSLIDYYIFAYVSCGLDSMGKNQIYMTYDGQKWFASMYDMDSTWGLYWNGQSFVSTSYRMQDDYESGANGNQKNLLYLRLEGLFIDEIKERYAVLRNGALTETNIINRFEEFMICSNDLIKEDYEIFNGIPSQDTNNIKQIRQYVVDRCIYVDEQINNLTIPVSCTGITLDKSSLTFTDNTPQTLQVTVEPENTTDKISYSINPTDIARINDGVVTPLKNGTATITVTCGSISKTCSVDVSGIEESDRTLLDLSSIQKGQSFTIYDGDLDLNTQTVFADITLDDSIANQNILSIGQGIDQWTNSTGIRIHCYYPKTAKTLEINLNNSTQNNGTVTINNSKLKMAINSNGIYVNGNRVENTFIEIYFADFVAQKTAQIGSLEGSKRSNATYNEISIYSKALSREELIALTTI